MPKLRHIEQAATYPSIDLSTRLQTIFRHGHSGAWLGRGQREVADRMQVHNSILSLWVRGVRPVPGIRIPGLAAALQMTVAELLDGVDLSPAPATRAAPPHKPTPPPPAPPAPTPLPQVPELLTTAGATGRPAVRRLDVFCLLCARGVGDSGLRVFMHRLPAQRRCATCGGFLLCEDVTGGMALCEERLDNAEMARRRVTNDAPLFVEVVG